MAGPPNLPNYTGQWIALVRRYECNFEDKIRNAQLANFDGVIVHNVNSSDLGKNTRKKVDHIVTLLFSEIMSANNSAEIYIPSVFVGEEAGWLLRDSYQYDSG
jgi:E3 ubiquitin-protein ligase RNF167